MHPWIAVVTLLTVLLLSVTMFLVGRARARHGVHAPATTGHPDFERAFRAQMNTLEQAVMFLPTLWVAGQFGDVRWAAGLGAVWLASRAWYVAGYLSSTKARGPGFMVGMLAWIGLVLVAAAGLVPALVAG